MAVPDFQSLMLPLFRMAADGEPHTLSDAVDRMAGEFQLSEEDRTKLLKSGQTRLYNRVGWSTTYLKKAGLLRAVGSGRFQVTDRGQQLLASGPQALDVAFLETQFPELSEFRKSGSKRELADDEPPAMFNFTDGTWPQRPGVAKRVREALELSFPIETVRRAALELVAFGIENADAERGDAWFVRETEHGLRLMAGRLRACTLARGKIRISVLGPVGDDIRVALGADTEEDTEFKFVPGTVLLTIPADHAAAGFALLKDSFNSFIEAAMARVRRAVELEDHVPEAVTYISSVVGRPLPQPRPQPATPESPQVDDEAEDENDEGSREPHARGRPPIFEHGQRSIASLVSDIERDVIALPDLQRPFVWEDTKVRDLLDSLFVGYPVGTLVLWHTSDDKDARAVGAERPGVRATTLIIDGQQRLTSLFAVMKGVDVVGKEGSTRRIMIAFRPRDGRFEVADAAIRNDPEFLPNVTELWNGVRSKPQIRHELMNALRDKGRVIGDEYSFAVESNLDRAHSIGDYRFPTVDIRKTAASHDREATEEDVAEIFVRINNQGTRLGQADFVLTLLSVFHGELRDRIEERAREMSDGAVIALDTQQLLRAVCGVAYGRARMSAVYRYLRGVDPATGETDAAGRLRRLQQLDLAARECMEPTPWRDFLLRVQHAGFVTQALIASKNAIVNAYAFYMRGRRVGVSKSRLDEVISRWVFGTLLTARYSGSSETAFEQDLGRVAEIAAGDGDGFVRAIDDALAETLSGDYWTHTLVAALETQKGRAPAALAFRAAQVVLGARALFSDQLLQNVLNPPALGGRSASEVHHLFPDAWLHGRGIHDRRRINQVANLADVGWHENNLIGARGPAEYVPRLVERLGFDANRWGRACAEHALPPKWEAMDYEEFLPERRRRMADLIRVAFRQLGGEAGTPPLTPPWFLPGAEVVWRRIADVERALRGVVRDVYATRFGELAARSIEEALPERDRETLARALRARPLGAEPLSVVDYLYLGQLQTLLFASEVWQEARTRFEGVTDLKQKVLLALAQIMPVRNEIAHVREVDQERLQRASLACGDVMGMLRAGSASSEP